MTEQPTLVINGAALREIRMRSGVSQKDLALTAVVTQQYLSALELGKRHNVSASVLDGLCRGLRLRNRAALLAVGCAVGAAA